MSEPIRLSVGIPVYNEEAVVPELLARIVPVLERITAVNYEVVFVDDGSTDRTRSASSKWPWRRRDERGSRESSRTCTTGN